MKEIFETTQKDQEDLIDLKELYVGLLKGKWIIITITIIFALGSVLYSLNLPNIYKAEALLAPQKPNSGISASIQNYSALASIAGINLPSQISDDKPLKAIKKLNSLSFFTENFLPNIFLPNLMAFNSWDQNENTLLYKENLYDVSANKWLINKNNKKKPSAQDAFIVFKSKHININEDKKSRFVTISIKHESPYIAKKWVEVFVDEINYLYRKQDKEKSELAIEYLYNKINETNYAETKELIALLLQQEIQKLALIEANKFYVYEYIDYPAVMEHKSEPNRSFICITGSILGFLISIFITLMKHFYFKNQNIISNKQTNKQ